MRSFIANVLLFADERIQERALEKGIAVMQRGEAGDGREN